MEFSALSFYFRSYGDLSPQELDRVCQFLHRRVQNQEKARLFQLAASFQAFKRCRPVESAACLHTRPDGGWGAVNANGPRPRLCVCVCVTALRSGAWNPAETSRTTAAASS